MNKHTYLRKLLVLCTKKQNDLFDRMYPEWPLKASQLPHAIDQVERTLTKFNLYSEKMKVSISETEELKIAHKEEIRVLNSILSRIEGNLKKAEDTIEKLSDPVNFAEHYSQAYINNRLEKLDALEAGGVDNWEWYGESLEQAGWGSL